MGADSQPTDLPDAVASPAQPNWHVLHRLRTAAAARAQTAAEILHAHLLATLVVMSLASLVGHALFCAALPLVGVTQFWPLVLAATTAALALSAVLALTAAGWANAAKHLLLCITTAFVVWVCVDLLGPRYDAQVYLLMIAVIPALLWSSDRWYFRVGYFALELGCYLWVTQGRHGPYQITDLPAWLELGILISTPVGAAASVAGLMTVYLRDLHAYERVLERQAEGLQAKQRSLLHQALHDPLTGLYNRYYLDDAIPSQLARAERAHQSLVVVMLDVDFFKRFNDSFGHPCGDELLRALAGLLQRFLRQGDLVGRFGGEEFLAVLIDTDIERALPRLEALRTEVASMEVEHEGVMRSTTVSIGAVEYPRHGHSSADLIHAADTARYAAKHAGRNCTRVGGAPG